MTKTNIESSDENENNSNNDKLVDNCGTFVMRFSPGRSVQRSFHSFLVEREMPLHGKIRNMRRVAGPQRFLFAAFQVNSVLCGFDANG